jgi:hypothetical protein
VGEAHDQKRARGADGTALPVYDSGAGALEVQGGTSGCKVEDAPQRMEQGQGVIVRVPVPVVPGQHGYRVQVLSGELAGRCGLLKGFEEAGTDPEGIVLMDEPVGTFKFVPVALLSKLS